MPPVELKPLPGPAPTLSPLPLPLPFPLLAAAAAAAAALCEDAVMPRKRQPLGSSETVQDMLQAIKMLDEQQQPSPTRPEAHQIGHTYLPFASSS